MYGSRIVSGLAAVFGGIAVLFAVFGVLYNLVFFFVAAMFGAVAYFMWYHASGRFARRLYRSVEDRARVEEDRGGFGAGPRGRGGFGAGSRQTRSPPRGERRRNARAATDGRGARAGPRGGRGRAGARTPGEVPGGRTGPTAAEAYRTLGLAEDADEDAVTAAYREKVKEVHPDSAGGDEESFKEVQAAYERLTDE